MERCLEGIKCIHWGNDGRPRVEADHFTSTLNLFKKYFLDKIYQFEERNRQNGAYERKTEKEISGKLSKVYYSTQKILREVDL